MLKHFYWESVLSKEFENHCLEREVWTYVRDKGRERQKDGRPGDLSGTSGVRHSTSAVIKKGRIRVVTFWMERDRFKKTKWWEDRAISFGDWWHVESKERKVSMIELRKKKLLEHKTMNLILNMLNLSAFWDLKREDQRSSWKKVSGWQQLKMSFQSICFTVPTYFCKDNMYSWEPTDLTS